jgi:acyl carrier protein
MKESEIALQLKEFICQDLLLEKEFPLTNDEPLLATGRLNSLLLIQLALYIEETFGVAVPNIDLTAAHFETVDRMTAWITASINL